MATIHSLFKRVPSVTPPAGLLDRVLASVLAARLRRVRERLALAMAGVAATVGYAVWNLASIRNEVMQSPFVDFVRLSLSDRDVMFAHLGDAVTGLIEAAPIMTILVVLSVAFCVLAAFALLQSFTRMRRDAVIHQTHHTIA